MYIPKGRAPARRRAWHVLAAGRSLLTSPPLLLALLAQPLALLGRHLLPALADTLALLRAHLPPALLIAEHALALLGRHLLPLVQPLLDPIAPVLRQPLPAVVCLLELLLALPGQLVPVLKVFEDLRALVGRELPKLPIVLARRLALLRG